MKRYKVEISGTSYIDAESIEDAREQASEKPVDFWSWDSVEVEDEED